MTHEELMQEAIKAMENSYSPYSHYPVGACVLCKDGKTFYGANIENASFGLTNCAERSAIFAAYSYGYRKEDIEAIAIVNKLGKIGAPCGACRQVLSELITKDTPIILGNTLDTITVTMNDIYPMPFDSENLNEF